VADFIWDIRSNNIVKEVLMSKIEAIGTIYKPESEDGGAALVFYGLASFPSEDDEWGNGEESNFRIDVVSFHDPEEGEPDHSSVALLTNNIGKRVKVTIEVMK
jgi:hypothetical protein